MDNGIIRKKLNTFKSTKGALRQVNNDVVLEVLRAWENWPGTAADLYRELGLSKMQLVTMIQKAKRLVKSGAVTESEFEEISATALPGIVAGEPVTSHCSIELAWDQGKVIRFAQVEQLIDFLKKAA